MHQTAAANRRPSPQTRAATLLALRSRGGTRVLPKHNQQRAPICEAIQDFRRTRTTTFTSPGHKAGQAVSADMAEIISRDAYRWDLSMLNGVDDRLESNDVQGQAEDLAAALYGADASYFS